MNAERAFERLIDLVGKEKIPRHLQNQTLSLLKYFRTQTRISFLKRDQPVHIQTSWSRTLELLDSAGLLARLKNDESYWQAKSFVQFSRSNARLPTNPSMRSQSDEIDLIHENQFVEASKYTFWSLMDLFSHLQDRTKLTPYLSLKEKMLLLHALDCLRLESNKLTSARKSQEIRQHWRDALPYLLKARLLEEFRGEQLLRKRLRFFLFQKI